MSVIGSGQPRRKGERDRGRGKKDKGNGTRIDSGSGGTVPVMRPEDGLT